MTSLRLKNPLTMALLCVGWCVACSNSVQLGAFNGPQGPGDEEDAGIDPPDVVDTPEDAAADIPVEEEPPEDECQPSEEVCDGLDNDCDGDTDEGLTNDCGGCVDLEAMLGDPCRECGVLVCQGPDSMRCDVQLTAFYEDTDGDGFGNDARLMMLCAPQGFHTAARGGDCNDNNPLAFPEAPRRCDGVDNNCDDVLDESCCGPRSNGLLDLLSSPPRSNAVQVEVAPHTNGDFMTVAWTEVAVEDFQAPGLVQAMRIEPDGLVRTGPATLSAPDTDARIQVSATTSGVHVFFLTGPLFQSGLLAPTWSATSPPSRTRLSLEDDVIEFDIAPRGNGDSDFATIAHDADLALRFLRTGRFVRDQRAPNEPLGSRLVDVSATSPRIASNTERAVVVVQLSQTVHVHRLTGALAFDGSFTPLDHELVEPTPDVALIPDGGIAVASLDRDFDAQTFGVRLVLLDEGGNPIGDAFIAEDPGAIFGPPRILTVEDGVWVVWPEGNPLNRIVGLKLDASGRAMGGPRTLVEGLGELSRVRLDLALGRRADANAQMMVLAGSHKTIAQDPFEPFVLPLDLQANALCFGQGEP